VPFLNIMTTTDAFASDWVCTSSIPSTEVMADSIGLEIRFSTSSGAASSYEVAMTAIGKSIFGNKSTAKFRTETAPRAIIAKTIMITPTGLFTAKDTNLTIIYLPFEYLLHLHLST